ncbi:hypothetical protein [Antrihabitans sp. YC2-6]|uniref:hypothetical protein n=1 Tax=Antrihabitans sp. YC2-6 TaxID=2799498 RepID=UPI0018F53FFC|nr:hypothetical protein [Antrihabitans sp. YC2-6]MBJ8348709.1 hypothetical protein [Antrihabitans sp. YC2-6]
MKSRLIRSLAVTGLAAVAVSLAGCSAKTDEAEAPSPGATVAADQPAPPLPSPEELNAKLQRALDPSVSLDEKVQWVQGGEADPELFDRIAGVYKQEGATIVVTNVTESGPGRMNASADFLLWGEVHPQIVPFVAESGEWKVEKNYACGVVQFAQLSSPACTGDSAQLQPR